MDDETIVALLHDMVEDSDWTLEALEAEGFPEQIVAAIDCLTSRDGEDYEEFITRVLEDSLTVRVRLLDIEDNMDMTRLGRLTTKDLDRLQKYHAARQRLLEVKLRQDAQPLNRSDSVDDLDVAFPKLKSNSKTRR